MKILIVTSRQRTEAFYDLSTLPSDWELVYLESFPKDEEVIAAGADAEMMFVNAITPIKKELINALPALKIIQTEGVAFNAVDIEAAAARGVYVCNAKGANSIAVAEHTVLLIMGVLRRIGEGDRAVKSGRQNEAQSAFILHGLHELNALKVGILGFGGIGKEVAARLKAFGCDLYYYDVFRPSAEQERELGVKYIDRDDLLGVCDIISLHMAVTPETKDFLNEKTLALVKQGAIIINTARGELVDSKALAEAIMNGRIAGAGFDTIAPEPVTLDNPLLQMPEPYINRILCAPHIGGTTLECVRRIANITWDNFKAVAAGERPQFIVNGL
jgi:lactate dehydrogenase-like 2-hydroxyacid dehydrogenase